MIDPRIPAYLRKLSRDASSEQAAGAYAYAAEQIESGAWEKELSDD